MLQSNNRRLRLLSTVLCAGLLGPALGIEPTVAEEQIITLHVPVQLKQIVYPDQWGLGEKWRVQCAIYSGNIDDNIFSWTLLGGSQTGGGQYVGQSIKEITLDGGEFNGIVEVTIVPHEGKTFSSANLYRCRIYVTILYSPKVKEVPYDPPRHYEARPDKFFQHIVVGLLYPQEGSSAE